MIAYGVLGITGKQRGLSALMPREVLHLRRETENARDTMNLYVSNLQTNVVGLLEPPALVPAGRRAAQWRSRPG